MDQGGTGQVLHGSARATAAIGRAYLFVAIDRTSKFAVAGLYDGAAHPTACQFSEELLKVVPYRIHILLTDNGIQFGPSSPGTGTPFSSGRAAST